MRFAFIAGFAAVGGGETLIMRRTRWLTSHGHSVLVACPEGPAVKLFEEAGATVTLLRNIELYPDALSVMEWCQLRERIVRALDGKPVDAIEVHTLSMLTHATFIAPVLGAKVLLNVIHPDSLSDIPDEVFRMLEERKALHSINAASLAPTEKRLGRPLAGALIVPVPVDVPHAEFTPRPMTSSPRILTVARLVHDKRYVLALIDTVKSLKGRFADIHLDVIGDGELRPRVEERVASLGLAGSVTLHGTVHPDQLHEHYERCDIFVGMGTAGLHAAAQSRPVVIAFLDTDEPITPGVLPDLGLTEFGERTPGGIEKPWLPVVTRLLEDAPYREDVARRGHALVQQHFSMDAVMTRWLGLVDEASAKPMAVPPPLWFDPPSEQKLIARRFLYNNPELYALQKTARGRLRAAVGLGPVRPRPRD